MKTYALLTTVLGLLQCLSVSSQAPPSGGNAFHGAGAPAETSEPPPPKLIVQPGETKSNGDVTVTNSSQGGTIVTVSPKTGDSTSQSTVSTNPGFQGAISGVDANDMVNLSSRQGDPMGMPIMVNTEGGTVSVKGGSHVSITNAASSGAATLVKLQNGTGFTMGPGSSVTILTS